MRIFLMILLIGFSQIAQASVFSKKSEQGIPMCDDPYLISNIENAVKEYHKENPSSNLLEKRKQLILINNLKDFKEVATEGFDSKQDFNVAGRIISLKINNSLTNDDMRLCKSLGEGDAGNLYLLIYYYDYDMLIDILNFLPNNKNFQINYQQIG